MKSKGNIIIVEAPQGGGKTTVTNILRDKMPYSNLLRLSGIKDKTPNGKKKVFNLRMSELRMMKKASGNVNFILDRCHITEQVYCNLGFKQYSFDKECKILNKKLSKLTKHYNVYIVLLETSSEEYRKRLHRDKPQYLSLEFDAGSSIRQQGEYVGELTNLTNIYPDLNLLRIVTTDRTPEDVAKQIMEHLTYAHLL